MKPSAPQPPKPNECPAWMMTFGDCMSLLVCFFVMLIAFSNMEEDNLSATIGAMRGALSGIEQVDGIEPIMEMPIQPDGLSRVEGTSDQVRLLTAKEMSEMVPKMISELRASNNSEPGSWPDRVLLKMLDDGMTIVVQSRTLFREGSADWLSEATELWEGIAAILAARQNVIRITAIISPQSSVDPAVAKSVWSLGVLRAETVAQALQTAMKCEPQRIGVGIQLKPQLNEEGYADDSVEITIVGQGTVVALDVENALPKDVWR